MTTVARMIPPTPNSTLPPAEDPLLAPPSSMPESPLLADERPPVIDYRTRTLLDASPVQRRMENLDALRIVCMLAIIITHVVGSYVDVAHARKEKGPLFIAMFAVDVGCRFGVPCFMMISFFIYWHQLYEKGRTWGELLKRRFKRLAPAFLCWSAFYFIVHKLVQKHFGYHLPNGRVVSTWDTSMWDFNWRSPRVLYEVFILGKAEYHLYYLPLVMQCLLLIPLLKLLWRRPLVGWAWTGLTALWWCIVLYGHVFAHPGSRLFEVADRIKAWTHEESAFPCLVFPLFGMMCAGQRALRNFIVHTPGWFWVAGVALGIALHAGESVYLLPHGYTEALTFLKIGRMLTAFCIFALVIRHPFMRDPFPRVSHYAFGLHFMHPAVILALSMLELRFFGAGVHEWRIYVLPMLAINLLLTFSVTFVLCLLVGRFKRLEFLVV